MAVIGFFLAAVSCLVLKVEGSPNQLGSLAGKIMSALEELQAKQIKL